MKDAKQKNYERLVEAARRYAASDPSDPFTFNRCMTHLLRGMCAPNDKGEDCHYNATASTEGRKTATGEEYFVTVYRDVQRV
jgi:hypothetical protein